jgi:glucose dehydrogenase
LIIAGLLAASGVAMAKPRFRAAARALAEDDSHVVWTSDRFEGSLNGAPVPSRCGRKVFMGGAFGNVYALNATTGQVRRSLALGQEWA